MTPYLQDADCTLYHGDALETLRGMDAGSVDCVVTSPPYWGLRDYGTGAWEGGDPDCEHLESKPSRTDASRASSGLEGSTETIHLSHTYRDVCGKCGARRVDQQLGLEPTPDQYVTALVNIFREVRRVLAPHGTCWVNLGDSFAGSSAMTTNEKALKGKQGTSHGTIGEPRPVSVPLGLKPKDLVGIPWRVARALQEPYYTGRIKDERDRIWLAAMVDAEGCIHIHRRKAGEKAYSKFNKADGTTSEYFRKNDTYGVMVTVDNTSRAIIDRCHEIVGQGSRYEDPANSGVQQRKQTLYRWTVTGNQARELLRELYPHLVAKQHEARVAYSSPSNGDGAARAHAAIKDLHNGRETGLDYPPPEGMWERGWFLRSEIIWAKCMPNPMPESVTDRPTKSHEQVFLLTKAPRYYFDQEAVREAYQPSDPGSGGMRSTFRGGYDGKASKKSDPVTDGTSNYGRGPDGRQNTRVLGQDGSEQHRDGERWPNTAGRNVRSVWTIATQPYPEAHFATYPEELVRRCVLAGCPVRVCVVCGKASERIVERSGAVKNESYANESRSAMQQGGIASTTLHGIPATSITLGWSDCGHNTWRPGLVLDPFAGSGTTLYVARNHGRHSVGIELNKEYCQLASRRLAQQSLLTEGVGL